MWCQLRLYRQHANKILKLVSLTEPHQPELASALRIRTFQQKRPFSEAVKAEGAFQALGALWVKAGRLGRAWHVLGAGGDSLRDSLMRQGLGGQTTGLVCPAGS